MATGLINDDLLAEKFRRRLLKPIEQEVLIARLGNSKEAMDSYTIVNCKGYGRVREFKDYKLYLERAAFPDRPLRPNFRGYPPQAIVRSQVFQLAACNWRCWYCFVDDDRLSANRRVSRYFSARDLIHLYLEEPTRVDILDLSGGQPDLVPEWTLWMIDECERQRLLGSVYFWIDDNLSNDFLFRYLPARDISRMATTPGLSRMGCFKGFDEASFAFTTRAEPTHFVRQFDVARRLLDAGFLFYAYVTFMTDNLTGLQQRMSRFVDRLQKVHQLLPLWTTPLKIRNFSATSTRMDPPRANAIENQTQVFLAWDHELSMRFSGEQRMLRPDQIR